MNHNENFKIIIAAMERGGNIQSETPVLQYNIAGKTILQYVIDAAQLCAAKEIAIIHKGIGELPDGFLDGKESIAVIYGNMPLITPEGIKSLVTNHTKQSVTAEIEGHNQIEYNGEQFAVVYNKLDLAKATAIMQQRINERHMLNGITIINPAQTYIDCGAEIGVDTVIYPNAIIEGDTVIGKGCTIGANSKLANMTVGNYVKIENSTLIDSEVGDYTTVGPYAYVRPNCKIGEHVKVGDFVEIKNSIIGNGTKISHLTYIGDADVGQNINFGCGTVMVNYDGKNKARVKIEDNAFIGCNSNLIAPVTVSEGAYIAAGSTITENVPRKSLAIARARQIIKRNWKDKRDL